MKIIIQVTGLSILLAFAGYMFHGAFTDLSFDQLRKVRIQTMEPETGNNLRWIFAVALGSIPLLILAMRKILRLTEVKQTMFSLSAILVSGLIFWQYKVYSLNTRYEELNQVQTGIPMKYYFARENLNLEIYLFLGFVIGAVIGSIGLYRSKNKK